MHAGGGNSIIKSGRNASGAGGRGLTRSRGGVAPSVGKGRKKKKHYPAAWGCPTDKMKMKKRVMCAYDGSRRLWKDELMLDNEFEVRLRLGDGSSYVTDLDVMTMNRAFDTDPRALDVLTIQRAEAFHDATTEEKGPIPLEEVERLMA